jgi:CheY-like chemotaxis protein
MRILIVDDTEINLRLMEAVLKPKGYEILKAALGEESVKMASENEIDLILMDISLPDINGTEAMKKIRKTKYGDKPIVAVTAHAMIGDKEKFEDAGFDGYISKPIEIQHTLKIVEELLNR